MHDKPIVLLNAAGFYDTLLRFLDECVERGVLKEKNRRILLVASTVNDVFELLHSESKATAATSGASQG